MVRGVPSANVTGLQESVISFSDTRTDEDFPSCVSCGIGTSSAMNPLSEPECVAWRRCVRRGDDGSCNDRVCLGDAVKNRDRCVVVKRGMRALVGHHASDVVNACGRVDGGAV